MLAEPESNPPPRRPPYGIYAYTGREWDPEVGLYYYRARYYDPKVGRFVSEDPLHLVDGVSLYVCVRNSPLKYRDPSGKSEEPAAPIPVPTITPITAGQPAPKPGEWPGETFILVESTRYCIYGFYSPDFGIIGAAAAAWVPRQKLRDLCHKSCVKCPSVAHVQSFFGAYGILARVNIDCSGT